MDFASASVEVEPRKLGVLFTILVVSLFAVSFPTISKLHPFFRIPTIVFFIGKHFGTGVILATAFIHLLDDAFRSLQGPEVGRSYPGLGKWTGAIILASLLFIFLIEYISTSYVERLQDKPSAPPTPVTSPPISRSQSPGTEAPVIITETTPLLPAVHALRRHTTDTLLHQHQHQHHHHHPAKYAGLPVEVLHNSPRICRLAITKDRVHGREEYGLDVGYANEQHHEQEQLHPRIGRRRQIIGILVLQLGIMIHSFVIGVTLAVTTGSDFTSLTTAVMFHQLFEGFSLGIRISALPSASSKRKISAEDTINEQMLQDSSNDVEVGGSAPSRRQGTCSPWYNLRVRLTDVRWFKPTLSFLFGVTTPTGMGLGLLLWHTNAPKSDIARMSVIQGIMSAISAGMLIYAATVEMLAGDFVFGDVEGGTHHHHSHGDDEYGHGDEREPDTPPCTGATAKQKAAPAADVIEERSEGQSGEGKKKASMGKRVLAVLSLLAGVGMMVVVALSE